jgi:hypothetical protein
LRLTPACTRRRCFLINSNSVEIHLDKQDGYVRRPDGRGGYQITLLLDGLSWLRALCGGESYSDRRPFNGRGERGAPQGRALTKQARKLAALNASCAAHGPGVSCAKAGKTKSQLGGIPKPPLNRRSFRSRNALSLVYASRLIIPSKPSRQAWRRIQLPVALLVTIELQAGIPATIGSSSASGLRRRGHRHAKGRRRKRPGPRRYG